MSVLALTVLTATVRGLYLSKIWTNWLAIMNVTYNSCGWAIGMHGCHEEIQQESPFQSCGEIQKERAAPLCGRIQDPERPLLKRLKERSGRYCVLFSVWTVKSVPSQFCSAALQTNMIDPQQIFYCLGTSKLASCHEIV